MASPRDKITLRRIAESSWVRPFAFLILIIVLWNLTCGCSRSRRI